MDTVTKSVAKLDAAVALSTKNRKDQHSEHVTVTTNNAATSTLLGIAVDRLYKLYALVDESASRQRLRDSTIPKRLFGHVWVTGWR